MRRHVLLIASLLALVLPAALARAEDKPADAKPVHKTVDADEFEKLSKQPDTVVLDVRTPQEYATGHIKDAVNVDFNAKDFAQKVQALDKSKTYLVHCAVGMRSAKACTKLDTFDFPKVYDLKGGIKAWKAAGKPVEK
jgi:rhodanese-related sulfurtransferase